MQKVALVTGSSRGIGRAIALRLAADGTCMVVNYRSDRQAADNLVAEIEANGAQAIAVQADVADSGQLRSLFDAAERSFGGLDILVNNVGTARFSAIAAASDEDFDVMFATNAKATFVALREAANRLRDGGRIVVISSGVTVANRPASGLYAASKAAGEHMVRALARELGPREITVNSVLPGATRTDVFANQQAAAIAAEFIARTPLGRIGEPADIADVVAFLTSASGRWITGQAIHAGGGLF
jgi:3-oxoacyl-[acyl-carrier protein] reductase